MTIEEAIEVLDKMKYPQKVNKNGFVISNVDIENEALDMAIQALSQEPCEDIAQERYKDLCEYFGGAKDILKSREDFKAWLGRVKWHIHKAEELYEKYEYKKEPCDDAISRMFAQEEITKSIELKENPHQLWERIQALPSVTQKSETVTEFADRCRECGAKYGKLLEQKSGKWIWNVEKGYCKCSKCGIGMGHTEFDYCPNCGAKMESEDKE